MSRRPVTSLLLYRRQLDEDEGARESTPAEFDAWATEVLRTRGTTGLAEEFARAANADPTLVRIGPERGGRYMSRDRFDELTRWDDDGGAQHSSGNIA